MRILVDIHLKSKINYLYSVGIVIYLLGFINSCIAAAYRAQLHVSLMNIIFKNVLWLFIGDTIERNVGRSGSNTWRWPIWWLVFNTNILSFPMILLHTDYCLVHANYKGNQLKTIVDEDWNQQQTWNWQCIFLISSPCRNPIWYISPVWWNMAYTPVPIYQELCSSVVETRGCADILQSNFLGWIDEIQIWWHWEDV